MVTWDDLANELNQATEEFEKMIKSFKSLSESYQEFIDYCKEIQKKFRRGNENSL